MKYDALITHALELIAALAGFYYLRCNINSKLRRFVYFLVFTICIEAIGSYTTFIRIFEVLKPVQKTIFKENFWLYNLYAICSLFFYILFYKGILKERIHKNILTFLLYTSIIIVSVNTYRDGIFMSYVKYNFLWVTFSVFICILLYFYEILMSNDILRFYKSPMFYISSGLLLWWLIFPSMVFYMPYYKEIYPEVVNFRAFILIGINVILYGCYTVGFLWGKEQ